MIELKGLPGSTAVVATTYVYSYRLDWGTSPETASRQWL